MSERSGWQLASGSVAEAYERYIMSPFGNAWAQALVQVAAPTEGERVLDVACGTGAVARFTAPLVGPTGLVTGLDLNAGMLDIARTMPVPKGAAIAWQEGSAIALPFPNASYDLVLPPRRTVFPRSSRRSAGDAPCPNTDWAACSGPMAPT